MSHLKHLLVLGLVLSACQQKPTKTYETIDNLQTQSPTAAELFQGEPVILDTRTPFDYNLSHVTGAVSIQWQDFSSTTPGLRGYLDQDHFALARRLALVGVHPQAKVIVVGYGPAKGQGEEGRVAWMLQMSTLCKREKLNRSTLGFQSHPKMPALGSLRLWKLVS